MFRPRVIPVLLLQDEAAVKTKQFANPLYLGDVVNTARIFSELEADELMVLDINATKNNSIISSHLVRELSTETRMPLVVGGGIQQLRQIETLIKSGAEKVILGSVVHTNPPFVKEAVDTFGSSTISVCLDIRENSEYAMYYKNGNLKASSTLEDKIRELIDYRVGEIIVQSIDKDGTRTGFDHKLIKKVAQLSTMPVVALGGCDTFDDLKQVIQQSGATACAASSIFTLFKSGVLISYPEKSQKQLLFDKD